MFTAISVLEAASKGRKLRLQLLSTGEGRRVPCFRFDRRSLTPSASDLVKTLP